MPSFDKTLLWAYRMMFLAALLGTAIDPARDYPPFVIALWIIGTFCAVAALFRVDDLSAVSRSLKSLAMGYLSLRHGPLGIWGRIKPPLGWSPFGPTPGVVRRVRYALLFQLWCLESILLAWARPPIDYTALFATVTPPSPPGFIDGAGI